MSAVYAHEYKALSRPALVTLGLLS